MFNTFPLRKQMTHRKDYAVAHSCWFSYYGEYEIIYIYYVYIYVYISGEELGHYHGLSIV